MNLFDVLFAKKLSGGGSPFPPVIKRVTGNSIEFTDGADAPLVKCVTEITGSQDLHGYDKPWVGGAGKNKLNTSSVTPTGSINGINVSVQDDGGIHITGTATQETRFTIDKSYTTLTSGTYVLSMNGATNGVRWISNGSNGFDYTSEYGDFTKVFNATGNVDIAYIYFDVQNGATVDNTIYIQLESGSTATTFAPYSNICPITAYTENTISVGAELLSYVAQSKYVVGVSGNLKTDGELELTGTGSSNNIIVWNMWDSTADINRQSNNKKNLTNGAYEITGCVDDKVGLQVYGSNTLNAGNNDSVLIFAGNGTFTIDDTYAYNWVRIMFYGGVAFDHTKFNFKIRKIEPHTTTYPSAIYRGSEDVVKGSVKSTWKKVVFDGSSDEEWSRYNYTSAGAFCMVITSPDSIARVPASMMPRIKANYLTTIAQGSTWGDYDGFISTRDEELSSIFTGIKSITTVEAWRTYLASNPLEVIYELRTPTTSSVTPTNLPIKSLSGYNHIESSTGDMTIDYITDAYQNFVDTTERAVPSTRKGGVKAFDIFKTLDEPKKPEASAEEGKPEEKETEEGAKR